MVQSKDAIHTLSVPLLLCLLVVGSEIVQIQAFTPGKFSADTVSSPLRLSNTNTAGRSWHLKLPASRRHRFQRLLSSSLFETSDDSVETASKKHSEGLSKAEELKRSAARIRLQAQEMEVKLIQEKLDKFYKQLEDANSGKKKITVEEKVDLTKQIQMLEYRLNPEDKKEEMEAMMQKEREEQMKKEEEEKKSSESSKEKISFGDETFVLDMGDADNMPTLTVKNNETVANVSSTKIDDDDDFGKFVFTVGEDGIELEGLESFFSNETRDCFWQSNETEYVGKLEEDDLKMFDDLEQKWKGLLELRNATSNRKAKQNNPFEAITSSLTKEENEEADEEEGMFSYKVGEEQMTFADRSFAEARAGNISTDELDVIRFISGSIKFVEKNIPFVVEVGMNIVEGFGLDDEDPLYMERFNLFAEAYDANLFSLRRNRQEEGIETVFCDEVLDPNPKIFSRNAKPRRVGSAFVIDGKVGAKDGNELIQQLQEALQKSSLKDKLNLFYLRDPSPQLDMDEVEQADFIQSNGGDEDIGKALELVNSLETPALLITGKNLESDKPVGTAVGITTFALLNLATTVGSYYGNSNLDPNYIQELVAGVSSPIMVYLLGTFVVQHVIQLLVALKGGFKISPLPTLIPGFWGIPLVGSSVSINSPPKNKNDMFDFGFAAPFIGFLVSYGFLVLGLESTMQMTNSAQIGQLPHIELDVLKQSFLTSATIETVMGTNVLLSFGDGVSSAVPVHPMFIAGYLGLMINAVQLIPSLVETNGGRAVNAALGRFSVGYGVLVGFTQLFLLIQAYRGGSPALDFVVLLFTFRLYYKPEMPCQNDVDNASGVRLAALALSLGLVCLTLSPA